MAQQTAVSWLIEFIQDHCIRIDEKIIEQAKAMEKEQIKKAYIECAEEAKKIFKEELKEFIVLPKTYGNL